MSSKILGKGPYFIYEKIVKWDNEKSFKELIDIETELRKYLISFKKPSKSKRIGDLELKLVDLLKEQKILFKFTNTNHKKITEIIGLHCLNSQFKREYNPRINFLSENRFNFILDFSNMSLIESINFLTEEDYLILKLGGEI